MPETSGERTIIFLLRICMGWVFLYAASHQIGTSFSVTGFLNSTKTFHALFAPMTGPAIAPILTFLVEYGHLLIGLSLIFGLMVRVSSVFGILLMLLYWMAHMDWPYITDHNNFIVDFHIVDAIVLWLLIVKRAGHVWGLDAWAEKSGLFSSNLLRWTVVS